MIKNNRICMPKKLMDVINSPCVVFERQFIDVDDSRLLCGVKDSSITLWITCRSIKLA